MLVLLIISLITINTVSAKSYTADNSTIISSQYIELFKGYFGDSTSYQYFTYKCDVNSTTRNCYYAIDITNNYIAVVYEYSSSGYGSYTTKIETGVDENFSVTGVTYEVKQSANFVILVILCLIFSLFLMFLLLMPLIVRVL